jgi:type II secretory pathway pseudopilin PulG
VSAAAFTLLEVLIGVLIIALLMTTLYRFVQANLRAIEVTSATATERQQIAGLIDFLQVQLQDLPSGAQGALLGSGGKIRDRASDQLEWVCQAGQGLFTTAAPGEYRATLAIQPIDRSKPELEIGLRRRFSDTDEKNYNWLPLLRPAAALEIRYFDPRLNAWIERWTDQNVRPSLVRVRIWRDAENPPYEAVLSVPSAQLNR